jgi:3-dehydroquinate synthase
MQQVSFPSGTVSYFFNESFEQLLQSLDNRRIVIITDEHVRSCYTELLAPYTTLAISPGEGSKDLQTIEQLTDHLLNEEVVRDAILIGLGGGVVTDITGFLAAIYMRGLQFGFVPTSLLGMVDAAIGGKNGVNLGLHKNTLGTITQPNFILIDTSFLTTLPAEEWSNGFAEIIKYACIFDAELFDELLANDLDYYIDNPIATRLLVERCVAWKNKTVLEDEKEKHIRKLLNFGHTAGHAIEKLYDLPHGYAVATGMVIAAELSEQQCSFDGRLTGRLKQLLAKYRLPATANINAQEVTNVLKMDKKRAGDHIDFILLEKIGSALIKPLPLDIIEKALVAYERNH